MKIYLFIISPLSLKRLKSPSSRSGNARKVYHDSDILLTLSPNFTLVKIVGKFSERLITQPRTVGFRSLLVQSLSTWHPIHNANVQGQGVKGRVHWVT